MSDEIAQAPTVDSVNSNAVIKDVPNSHPASTTTAATETHGIPNFPWPFDSIGQCMMLTGKNRNPRLIDSRFQNTKPGVLARSVHRRATSFQQRSVDLQECKWEWRDCPVRDDLRATDRPVRRPAGSRHSHSIVVQFESAAIDRVSGKWAGIR